MEKTTGGKPEKAKTSDVQGCHQKLESPVFIKSHFKNYR